MGWGRYYGYYGGFRQPTVAEMEESAKRRLEEAKRKGLSYHPVCGNGRRGSNICSTWWGKSWCENLERYADYQNRISRGMRYLQNHCVLDLQIHKGLVEGVVSGSSIYQVSIRFDPLKESVQKEMSRICSEKIHGLEELVQGRFPQELKDAFFKKQGGLFPTPREIHFSCSCPDWASMCKHVAAVMYGTGILLDEDPLKFFELRGIDVEPFVTRVVTDKVETMLKNARKGSERILEMGEVEDLIGILS